jgi:fido (protein-threonine AMPylation protein)
VAEILTDRFVRDLHAQLYGALWTWAGRYRVRETNIGVAPERIAVDLRAELDSSRWRWENTSDLTPRELGIAAHAIVVRIHPFVDGNGRTTRLLADLVFAAAQTDDQFLEYDWQLDRAEYIRLLREFDHDRDPTPLARFVQVRPVGS